MAVNKKSERDIRKKGRTAASRKRRNIEIFAELEALSASKSQDRLRLAYLARKASHQVHRSEALQKLRKRPDEILSAVLPIALVDKGELVRVEALEIIAEYSFAAFEAAAVHALKDRNWLVQDRAVWALAAIRTPTAIRAVKKFLPEASSKARVAAEAFLYNVDHDVRRVDRLIALLEDEDQSVRRASSNELASIVRKRDLKRTIEAIEAAIGREQYRVTKLHHRRQIRYLRSRFVG